jgi:hypothetical protein
MLSHIMQRARKIMKLQRCYVETTKNTSEAHLGAQVSISREEDAINGNISTMTTSRLARPLHQQQQRQLLRLLSD